MMQESALGPTRTSPWFGLILALLPVPVYAEAGLRALVGGCADGDLNICQQLTEADVDAPDEPGSLEALASAFRARAPSESADSAEGPPLQAAYEQIVADYFAQPTLEAAVRERYYLTTELPDCAAHYADVWLHERRWWPTDGQGALEWKVLYLHALDHYFGYCLNEHRSEQAARLRPTITRLRPAPPAEQAQ